MPVLWGGAIVVEDKLFWAQVISRVISTGIQPQQKMCLYTVAFQCEKPQSRARLSKRWAITPVIVQVLHLIDAKKIVVHYSLDEPDRNGQGDALLEPEIRRIEPHLAVMVEQAMQNAGINVEHCCFEVRCVVTNLLNKASQG